MAKRNVYAKDSAGFGDFIYVDLLPEVKRARQFNLNVVVALLFAIVLSFFAIYQPYRDNTFELEQLTSINNDREHELSLTQEEFDGNEIDMTAIQFEADISQLQLLRVDFNNMMDSVELIIDSNNGRLRTISYDMTAKTLTFEVAMISQFGYNAINNQLLNEPWVDDSDYGAFTQSGDGIEYISTFTIEVNYDVE